jgi:hypothetical protein
MTAAIRWLAGALAAGTLIMPAIPGAQPGPRVRVGIFSSGAPREGPQYAAFIKRLGDLGYVEDRNLISISKRRPTRPPGPPT